MAAIQVAGPWGDYWVDSSSNQAWRRGSKGGAHDVMDLSKYPSNFQKAAREQIDLYNRATAEPENPFGEIDWGALFSPSEQEQELLDLQIQQIRDFVEAQDKLTIREEARRTAYERFMTGGAFTATTIEEQQGILAARAAKISELEQTRLNDALEGKLPVSPSTERAIAEGAAQLAERNIRDFGQLGVTSTPALERQQRFDESAEILKDTDRQGYLERGIRPSIDAATFAAQQIGEYVPGEIPGAATALQGLRQNRQMAASTMASLAGAGARADTGAAYGLASSGAYGDQLRAMRTAGEGGGGFGGALGGGLGSIIGGLGGAVLGTMAFPGLGTIGGASIGGMLGGGLGGLGGGAVGGSLGSGLSGGSYMPSLYGGGGGFNYGAIKQSTTPGYTKAAYYGQSFPHTY